MQHKNLTILLSVILTAVCIFLAVNLVFLYRNAVYLPDSTVKDIVSVLAAENIRISPDIISNKHQQGMVYVCSSENYNRTVAELLGKSTVASAYVIPDGEILLLTNGARFDFGEDFSFRYSLDGSPITAESLPTPDLSAVNISEEKRKEITGIVTAFLDSGSREFESGGNVNIRTDVENIWENDGQFFALCSRSIDGVAVAENYVLCTVSGDLVTEAFGSWSFLTFGQSYATQLSDVINILFHVRQEISSLAEQNGTASHVVTITSINNCYSLYYFGTEEDFCLIPCWQIVTDTMGEFIYNAIDSTLYTKTNS